VRTHKYCPVCKRTLPWEAFGQDLSQSIGIKGLCKECFNAKQRAAWAGRTEEQRLARNQREREAYHRRKARE
jgi:hypothetical protein